MTDNGARYPFHAFADALGEGVKHRPTRPFGPQTNGKGRALQPDLTTDRVPPAPSSTYPTTPAQRPTPPRCASKITTEPLPASKAPLSRTAFTKVTGNYTHVTALRVENHTASDKSQVGRLLIFPSPLLIGPK